MSVAERPACRGLATWSAARRLALLIAVGIGLHNFAEGLAIGQSAARNEIALAMLLVVGFALHNATEGFGIVAPLAADVDDDGPGGARAGASCSPWAPSAAARPSSAPSSGTASPARPVSVIFLALAAGSILYVVCQLLGGRQVPPPGPARLRAAARAGRRLRHRRHRHRRRSLSCSSRDGSGSVPGA